jgi:2-polyprenyl-3-methyl-5-hydroxy-6-metoxy-1,4-benzoquinol methylase
MTWGETIEYIRQSPEYADLVRFAYFEKNLPLNVERFIASEEWKETWKIVKQFNPRAKTLLDVGCGAGFTSIAFALNGLKVTSLEPDPDPTIGYGAIKTLAGHFNVQTQIASCYFEENNLTAEAFDIVYARQSMHHASNLQTYVSEAFRVLKPGGILFTVRDHIANNEVELERFLATHPLHKFYGGENAYSEKEYVEAMKQVGFKIQKVWRYYDNVLNYYPLKRWRMNVAKITDALLFFRPSKLSEAAIPGRMYSFLAIK